MFMWDISFLIANFGGEKQKNIVKTPLLEKIVETLSSKINNEITYDAVVYSAHDSTLFNLMNGLGITSWECLLDKFGQKNYNDFESGCTRGPRFASNIVIELHK